MGRPARRPLLPRPGGAGGARRLLDRHFLEEGATSLLPGGSNTPAWRCDPVPLILPPGEFDALAAGLAQRASLLEAVLQDVYGPQTLLAEGLLPPALVYANPAFLRSCRDAAGHRQGPLLHLYAADLLRAPDGQWRVLADRTAGPTGLAHVLENRRALSRYVPELVRARDLRRHGPFFDIWQDALQRLAPPARRDGRNPGVAMLTSGHSSPHWYEHVILSRRLSCALVEGGDLTVRDGALYLKTLRGLQPVDVLLRRVDGRQMDPLEGDQSPAHGVAGLLDAVRGGTVRIVNDPGAGFAEAPALAAFLPALAQRLLGEELRLAGARTLWLATRRRGRMVGADLGRWMVRRAVDGKVRSITAAALPDAARAELAQRILAAPEDYAVSARMPASVAPCSGPEGLEPRPVILRLFLVHDGTGWQALQGGLAHALLGARPGHRRPAGHALQQGCLGPLRRHGRGPGRRSSSASASLPIRRGTGDLPSRVADNFFWLGRYLERLESAARLLRASASRLATTTASPRELAELTSLAACLVRAQLLDAETAQEIGTVPVTRALLRAVREKGRMQSLLNQVGQLGGLLRDRLTGEMHLALNRGLRQLADEFNAVPLGREEAHGLEALGNASAGVLAFAATVAGLAAGEHGARRRPAFLDLGRRVERAQAIVAELTRALDQPGAASPAGAAGAGAAAGARAAQFGHHLPQPLPDRAAGRRRCWTWCWPTRAIRAASPSSWPRRATCWWTWTGSRGHPWRSGGLPDRGSAGDGAAGGGGARPGGGGGQAAAPAGGDGGGDRRAVRPHHPALVRAAAGLPQPGTGPGGPAARRRVIYRVRHTTRYAYGSTVDLAAHMLHLRPRDLPYQRVVSAGDLHAAGGARAGSDGLDHFGNAVTWLFIDAPHDVFEVTAEAEVEVRYPDPPAAEATLPWEQVAALARAGGPGAWQAAEFRFDSPMCAGGPGRRRLCGGELPGGPAGAGRAARPQPAHPHRFPLPRRA